MATDAPSSAPSPDGQPSPSQRRQPRAGQSAAAFVQRLDNADATPLSVKLVDRSPEGLAFNAMIPFAEGTRIVVNTTDAPKQQLLLLARVVHCTKLGSGRFQIGVAILERLEGNLHTTKIPDAWRQA